MIRNIFIVLLLTLTIGLGFRYFTPQEERTQLYEIQREEASDELIDVVVYAETREDEKHLDVLWLYEAADRVRNLERKYFNVVEQNIGSEMIDENETTYMQGVIEITDDTGAEYDSEEILRFNIKELAE